MTDKELKPCPFCGSDKVNVWLDGHIPYGKFYFVRCEKCLVYTLPYDDRDLAVKIWNTRTDVSPQERINLYERLELVNNARKQAIKEFVEKLIKNTDKSGFGYIHEDTIRDIARGMVGADNE